MNRKTIKGLLEHARTAPLAEAKVAIDLAQAAIRHEKLEALSTLIESHVADIQSLENIRRVVAYSVTSGQSTPEIRRLYEILNTKPTFEPKAGIRAAIPCFEWAQKHSNEITDLLAKI
jgi:hypothetical protein